MDSHGGRHGRETCVAPMKEKEDERTATVQINPIWYVAGVTGLLTCATLPFLVVPWLPKQVFGALPCEFYCLSYMPSSCLFGIPITSDKRQTTDMHTPSRKIQALFRKTLPRYTSKPPHFSSSAGTSSTTREGEALKKKKFIDLGSGLGEAVIEARRQGYEAKGVELNPTLFLLSIVNAMRHFGPVAFLKHPRLTFNLGNFWSVGLHDYDVIMVCYPFYKHMNGAFILMFTH